MAKQFIKGRVTKPEGEKYRWLAPIPVIDRQGDSIDKKGGTSQTLSLTL